MIKFLLMMSYLILMSILDIRKRKVPVVWVLGGLFLAFAEFCFRTIINRQDIMFFAWEFTKAILPGIIMLFTAFGTGKAGYADGILLMATGLTAGYRINLFAWFAGSFLLAVCSLILLAMRKVTKETKMPYIPFLAAGQAAGFLFMNG